MFMVHHNVIVRLVQCAGALFGVSKNDSTKSFGRTKWGTESWCISFGKSKILSTRFRTSMLRQVIELGLLPPGTL